MQTQSGRVRARMIRGLGASVCLVAIVAVALAADPQPVSETQQNQTESGGTVVGTVSYKSIKTLENAVVYIKTVTDSALMQPEAVPVVMDQKKMTFIPHVLPVVVGQKVEMKNSDAVLHNIHAYRGKESVFNIAVPPNPKRGVPKSFKQVGVNALLCDLHPEMSAFIVVLENRLFATSDTDGAFVIQGVPPGDYSLLVWHEKYKLVDSIAITVEAGSASEMDIHLVK